MSVYFISDLHLGCVHHYCYCARPFSSYRQYEDAILNNLNKQLATKDTLYIVGDLLDYNDSPYRDDQFEAAAELIQCIPGRKQLVMGNNEERLARIVFGGQEEFNRWILGKGISQVETALDVLVEGAVLHLVHRPTDCVTDKLNLYGHVHQEMSTMPYGINVCCDLTGYYALSVECLIARVDRLSMYSLPGKHMGGIGSVYPMKLWCSYRDTWFKQISRIHGKVGV